MTSSWNARLTRPVLLGSSLPFPGPACQLADLEGWQRAWPSAFAAFHVGWVWGYFVFLTGNVTAALNLIEVFCMHTPRPSGWGVFLINQTNKSQPLYRRKCPRAFHGGPLHAYTKKCSNNASSVANKPDGGGAGAQV